MTDYMGRHRPIFSIIGGPNGVGKSTFVEGLQDLGYELGEGINPDDIQKDLKGPHATRAIRAGREALLRTRALIRVGQSFYRETTLSGNEIIRTMQTAKDSGFELNLYFIGIDSLHTCQMRVQQRVLKGGHDIPIEAQVRRFKRSFDNAIRAARIADATLFVNNANDQFKTVGIATSKGNIVWCSPEIEIDWLDRIIQGLGR